MRYGSKFNELLLPLPVGPFAELLGGTFFFADTTPKGDGGGENNKFPVLYFYLRRLFRIAPLFWCGIVFTGSFPM
jgi:peptidoglycan/LPS O-acetylase OafA/YrhL